MTMWARQGVLRQFVVFLLLASEFGHGYYYNRLTTDSNPPTFIGCQFLPTLCRENEYCFDDNLFGSCQRFDELQDSYRFSLDEGQLNTLGNEIERLLGERYVWSDLYTQCVLENVLFSFRYRVKYFPGLCDTNFEDWASFRSSVRDSSYLPDDNPSFQGSHSVYPDNLSDKSQNDGTFLTGPSDTYYDTQRDNSLGGLFKKNQYITVHKYVPNEQNDRDESYWNSDEQDSGSRVFEDTGNNDDIKAFDLKELLEYLEKEIQSKDLEDSKDSGLAYLQQPNDITTTSEQQPVSSHDDEKQSLETHIDIKQSDVKRVKTGESYRTINTAYIYLSVEPRINSHPEAEKIFSALQQLLKTDNLFSDISFNSKDATARVNDNDSKLNASSIATYAVAHAAEIQKLSGYKIVDAGVGRQNDFKVNASEVDREKHRSRYLYLTVILCGLIAGIILFVIVVYVARRHMLSKKRLADMTNGSITDPEISKDYQELCRQHMQTKLPEKCESAPPHGSGQCKPATNQDGTPIRSPSSRSSTSSSWSEEPVTTNIDITTGHIVLSYMEDHLKNKERLNEEWQALCAYEAETSTVRVGLASGNISKNRYIDILPYDHNRVSLNISTNPTGSDYINASTITDHDPRNPAYIATQGPLPDTVQDFWQMVWEQGCVVIVNLTKQAEGAQMLCHRYWPEEGSQLHHIFEIHLVSEHIWCEDYMVRNFYLKNLITNETRTVTQFHFLTWPDLKVPHSVKAILDFRRKVNKSYRGRTCPIVVHCSDGVGRTGTYCLLDMVLNRMMKGTKEIDIAATLEHIRDQRMLMVKTKEQFEFALAAVAEEVHAMLKALPQ